MGMRVPVGPVELSSPASWGVNRSHSLNSSAMAFIGMGQVDLPDAPLNIAPPHRHLPAPDALFPGGLGGRLREKR